MNLLPKSRDEFTKKDYWDNFFMKRGSKQFEWCVTLKILRNEFQRKLIFAGMENIQSYVNIYINILNCRIRYL